MQFTHIEHKLGNKRYELSNHLGNVLAVVTDKKIGIDENADGRADYYLADVLQAQDYYPFGMEMPGRTFTKAARPQNYRFGFNGKEQDPEVYGQGNIYDYGFRIYNPRIAKFLSVDPLTKEYPMLTPYQFASNTPIQAIDLDGLEAFIIKSPMLSTSAEKSFTDKDLNTLVYKMGYASARKFPDDYAHRKLPGIVGEDNLAGAYVDKSLAKGEIKVIGTRWIDPNNHNKGGEVYVIGRFFIPEEPSKSLWDKFLDFFSPTKEESVPFGFPMIAGGNLGEWSSLNKDADTYGDPIDIKDFLGGRGGGELNKFRILDQLKKSWDLGIFIGDRYNNATRKEEKPPEQRGGYRKRPDGSTDSSAYGY